MIRTDELFHVLRNRAAILPGSRDRNRRPIIFVPLENQNLSVDQLRAVLLYLIEWTCEHDRQNRFVFVVDMRNGATGNILKSLLKTLEEEFKNLTAVVFVVKPEKFWEKHKASVTSGKYSFDVQTVQLDQLTKTIDLGQIIREFGGQLQHNHQEWIEIRKTIENIRLRGSEMVRQYEDYCKEIRNCLLPTDLNGHSPDQYFQILQSIESGLQAIRNETLDNGISVLHDRLTRSSSHSQNPDFANTIPALRHLANQVNRVKKEVYDRLNEKRRELDRGSQLLTFENEASHTLKFLVSYIDQITKVAYEIGKNEEQAKQLARNHRDLVDSVNRIEPTFKHVLDTGQRLLNSNAGVDIKIENYLRPLKNEWANLHRHMEDRNALLENALKFHANYSSYQKQASDWIASAGSNQIDIISMTEEDLIQNNSKLQATREKWESVYSETLSHAVELRKKLEHRGHGDKHMSSELIAASIDNIIRLNQQLNNVLESRHLSVRQRLQFLVLLPEIETVIKWLDEHGEPFLKRKIAIGHDSKSSKGLAEHHEKFCEIASLTYQNAKKLFVAAKDVIKNGEADVQTINEQVNRLQYRINRFTQKVEHRTRLLLLAGNFFGYYAEIMAYYGNLDQRNKKIRIIAPAQTDAEQNKENFQRENEVCEQAYEAIITKANQLVDELGEQQRLLEIRNSETVENVQLLINMIQQKHLAEKNRWPGQREILKHAAYVSGFLKECAVIYEQIQSWDSELQTLPEQLFQQHSHMPNIAQYHKRNMVNVEEAVNDALRRTTKITESIATMGLVMQNGEPAVEAVMKMGRKLQELEDSVMKVARKISEHFQWKKVVDRIGQEADDLIKKINMFTDELRMMPCLAFNASEVEEQSLQHMALREKIGIMKELVLTFELNVKRREEELIAIDLIQKLKEHSDFVKMNFAQLVHLLESRLKLINFAAQYYKCLASAIPAIESIEKTYNYDTSDQCVSEQKEELSRRLDLIRDEIQSYKTQRVKFVNALNYAQRCADQFNNRLRRFEENQLQRPNRLTHDRCRMLQAQVHACIEDIAARQTHLLQLWTKRNDKNLACEESCLLEIFAKQISDYFELKTTELQQRLPQKQVATLSSLPDSEIEALLEFILGFERSYKSELKKIGQLNERLKDFYEHIRTSFHFEFVERAVKQVEEQSKRFEELLRNYHQKCTMALGKNNVEIMSRNANRHSDGSLEERISQQSRESNDFIIKDENARKLREPMRELLATERDYINDLQKCIDVYLRAYRMSEQSAPPAVRCKERELFGNIEDLFQFHANQFIETLSSYEQTPELVYCCFCTYVERLKDLYTEYILNNVENNSIIDVPEVKQHFEAIQLRYKLEQNHSLQSMLIKPIQRLTRYPLLLSQLIEHSTENRKDMQVALNKMINITREANDRVHLKYFEQADNFRIGDFVMTDTFVVSEPKRYFGRDKERQVFLFESNIVFAKKEELPSKKIRYLCKYRYLLSDIHIVEHLDGDPTKFGLRKGNLPAGDNTTILKASSKENRKQWLIKIRELILEMPIKVQAESSENGSLLSYYNGSLESVKKLSLQENNRTSTSSTESNTVKQTSSNGTDPHVEMRRPRNLLHNQKFEPLQNGITLSNDNFLLPLDENHYENLMPELSNDTPASSVNHKRSTVSSTASSDIDLPPAMSQLPGLVPPVETGKNVEK